MHEKWCVEGASQQREELSVLKGLIEEMVSKGFYDPKESTDKNHEEIKDHESELGDQEMKDEQLKAIIELDR